MSTSKQSSKHSNSSNTRLEENRVFNVIVPSKIFSIAKYPNVAHPFVQPELNRKMAMLTDPVTLNYTTDIKKIIRVLRDRTMVEYQQRLMETAIDNISEDTIDIDYIRIGLTLTATDIDKLLDSKNGLIRVRTQNRREHLTVKMMGMSNKNCGFKKSDRSPFFTKRFIMFADDDDHRCINLFIADPAYERNRDRQLTYNCEIEYIPTRVSNELASFMLYQLQSVLTIRRYHQLISCALLLELHTGYIMYGVSQLFGFMLTRNNRVKIGQNYPEEQDMTTETTYVASRASNHLIGYDKTLKENKKFIERAVLGWDRVAKGLVGIHQWFPDQVCSYRLESRCKYDKAPVDLVDICTVTSLLEDVRLIRPKQLFDLDDTELAALVYDKSLDNCRDLLAKFTAKNNERRKAGKKGKFRYFWFSKRKVKQAVKGRTRALLEAITHPVNAIASKKGNYSAAVGEAKGIVEPLINATCSKSHKVTDIVKAKQRAIYVEGCPGSGKTRLVVRRVGHLLEKGIKDSEIGVLAFTNKAAEAFTRRLKKRKLYRDNMFVGTFSGWCNRLLNIDEAQAVLNAEASLNVLQSLIPPKSKMAKKYVKDEVARRCQTIFNHMANFDDPLIGRSIRKVAPDLVDFEGDISALLTAYNEYKEDRCRDFNDLLVQLRQRLKDDDFCQRVLKQTKHLIIDEIQDTNKIQWDIIKTLYRHGIHFFCVGDPAQSMYGFRGAKHAHLDAFTQQFQNSKRFQLAKNHRSTTPLVRLTNEIRYKINPKYSIPVSVREEEDAARPQLRSCDKLQDAIGWLVHDIKMRRSSDSQFILCRYNKQVARVERALKKAQIEHGEEKAIQVHTYHKAKGLEANHCYVIDPQFSNSKLSSYKEELCNAYVALTRAKQSLTILACNSGSSVYGLDEKRGKRAGRSIFLDLPEDKLEYVDE